VNADQSATAALATAQNSIASAPIPAPDCHFLNGAIGWLELGNPAESKAELDRIAYTHQFHPDVLAVRWKIYARTKKWERSLDIARMLTAFAPERASSWICLAHSLCNTQQSFDAWHQLRAAHARFPTVSAIPYYLARLSRQIGNIPEAARWLLKWDSMEDKAELRKAAENDPYLQPIWEQLIHSFGTKPKPAKRDETAGRAGN
jgi:lipopolysaccharide biosynthesis regulator YciM